MTPTPPRPPLPLGLRLAVLAAVALGSLVNFQAIQQTLLVLSPPQHLPPLDGGDFARFSQLPPALFKQCMEAALTAQLDATAAMAGSRTVVLIALSVSAMIVFINALRLRWPAGVSREPVARVLGAAAIVAGLLRAVDGAQEVVVSQRFARAAARVLAAAGDDLGGPLGEAMTSAVPVMTGFFALLVSALLLGLGQYFRSERVALALELERSR